MPGQNSPGDPIPGGGGGVTRPPPGTSIYTPPVLALGRPAVKFYCMRDDGTPLPNIRFLGMEWHEFTPPTARFRYAFNVSSQSDPADPTRVEQVMALDAAGPRVVKVDDRVRVVRQVGISLKLGQPTYGVVFDGFVVAPEAHLSGQSESVTFTCVAAPVREYDAPLAGAVYRDSPGLLLPPHDATDPAKAQDIATELPVRFNPDGLGNCVPTPGETTAFKGAANEYTYPVFADPAARVPGGGQVAIPWTLGRAVRYLMATTNTSQKYVLNPDLSKIDDALKAAVPKVAGGAIDLSDPTTYTLEEITVPDLDVTGDAWPEAVRRLVEPHGFGFAFDLSTNALGKPEWRVRFYRKDGGAAPKSLYLQKPGTALVPGPSNLLELQVTRDTAGVQNQWRVATEPVRYEATFVLMYEALDADPDPADVGNPSLYTKGFDAGPADAAFDPTRYRTFVVGEGGGGFWSTRGARRITLPADLAPILQPPVPPPAGGPGPPIKASGSPGADARTFAQRNRAPIGKLFSRDASGKPLDAQLWICTDNYSEFADVWDPASPGLIGTPPEEIAYRKVGKGGWRLLEDRIGIEITTDDPKAWHIGQPGDDSPDEAGAMPFPSKIVNVPACVNGNLPTKEIPLPDNPRFVLVLTCVIEGDHDIAAVAKRRPSSPSKFAVERLDDSRDRFQKHVITDRSKTARDAGATRDTVDVDDTDEAQAHADSRRRSNENGSLAGSFTVGYYSEAYRVGDLLGGLAGGPKGRKLSFAQNVAVESGEAPVFPIIIGASFNADGGQAMSYSVQDYRAEIPNETRRRDRD